MLPLTATDLHLARIDGQVKVLPTHTIVRTPSNPDFYHGNFLLLPRPPTAESLPVWIDLARETFPASHHVLLRWDDDETLPIEVARAHAMERDEGLAMAATALIEPPRADLVVRRIDPATEWDRVVALNRACDPSEIVGEDSAHTRYRERRRAGFKAYVDGGHGHWWGAFDADGQLIGQCGMVDCPEGRARFQAVEVHPAHRRHGVCSTLITAVGRDAFARGHEMVLLAADPEGPARGLYGRLGFEDAGWQRSLLRAAQPRLVRDEAPGDTSEADSLTAAAFGGMAEVEIIRRLRRAPGVISLVAVRAGTLQGHALFSPVRIEAADGSTKTAIALGPIAVKPTQQRQGVGRALIEAGLERCRAAGWSAAFVLGDPAYYRRFGWQPASDWGLRCIWSGVGDAFMALPLTPDGLADSKGLVHYDPIFGGASDA